MRAATPKAPLAWSSIKLFVMDVDGILTDGTISVSSDGTESKSFSIVDGLGLVQLRRAGIILAWISGRQSLATTRRAEELKIHHLVQGRVDKITALKELLNELQLTPEQTVYMGDDIVDVDAIRHAGIGVTVPEAQDEAIEVADFVTSRSGGKGAVREVCNHLLKANQR